MKAKLKTGLSLLLAAVLGSAGTYMLLSSRTQPAAAVAAPAKTLYTCGMHPQIIQDHPGNCPICGMKLTPIRQQPGAAAAGERRILYYKSTMTPGETSPTPAKDSMGMEMTPVYAEAEGAPGGSTISIDPATIQQMDIRTVAVRRGPLRRIVRTVGTVNYDETSLADVTTKFRGWIEKLYVDATGERVHRGDPLFEIYSPELYSAQVEYVLAIKSAADPTADMDRLRASARTKLSFFDISDAQIAEVERLGAPLKTLRILAPQDGFAVEKNVVEGQMVDAGSRLYRLADLALVWIYAQIYEGDLVYIKLGQEATVTLDYLPDREFRGRVTYIYPNVDEKTRTAQVRMEFHNPGYFLKPGMFATVQVVSELQPSVLLIPNMAVLRSGEQDTVFVALPGGKFDPRTVALGPLAENDEVQAIAGLREGERIVTSGQFMLDSESQLREAIQKMREPTPPPAAPRVMAATGTLAAVTAPAAAEALKYVCPMPEHVSIAYDHPGTCPICGMTLVPVTPETLRMLQPGGKVLYYTCPMPEHADVRSDKPGKCPKCGMTLIPVMEPATPATSSAPPSPLPSPLYTCPMAEDADVVSDTPGKCPKCGMELVDTRTVAHGKIAEEHWRKQHPASAVAPPAK